ncbi:MAG: hypothetical protein R3F14_30930 [Polyangiaceae bacterium]
MMDQDAAGNLTFKSDVGNLDHGESAHPHCHAGGGATYEYDAMGRQTVRPRGTEGDGHCIAPRELRRYTDSTTVRWSLH